MTEQADFLVSDTDQMNMIQLAEALNAGFEGYLVPVNFTAQSQATFCRQFSIDTAQSLLIHHPGGRLAGVTLLGVRDNRGWCGGFGITPEFRGQGANRVLLAALIERAQSLNLQSLQLEVLARNERAIKMYRRAGFQVTRDLVILSAEAAQVLPQLRPGHSVQMEISDVEPQEALRIANRLESNDGFGPCWQCEPTSLGATSGTRGIVATRGGRPLAVLLYRYVPTTGQINILNLTFYNEAAAKALLERAAVNSKILRPKAEDAKPEHFFILNEPENSELFSLLSEIGLQETNRQHEMVFTRD